MAPWPREVDKALEDDEIVEAVVTAMRSRWRQSVRRKRAGTPAEVALRMLVLKHLRDWNDDELEREVIGILNASTPSAPAQLIVSDGGA